MKKQRYIILLIFGILLFPQVNYAQVDFNKKPDDDLGDNEDAYQELFFEALKQKGIENYDRAIEALLKCENIDDSDAALFFELGKNYNKLKNFGAAEDALQQAIKKQPDNEWYLDELYDVYAKQNNLEKAIKTVKQLVKYHPDYKEDLATLYVKTKKYDDALEVLDEMDAELGVSETRDRVRNMIYNATGNKKEQIENLEERVEENPELEINYLSLIFRYSENNEKEKAFETAKKLLQSHPNSQMVHLALYKFYLDDNEAEKAVASMEIVLNSSQIKPEAKMMVLADFVKFVGQNPEYESQLVAITSRIADDEKGKSNIEVAQYFLTKGEKDKALAYYEKALEKEPENYGVLRNVLLLYIDVENYTKAVEMSEDALDKYPSQPIFYLVHGVAQNKLHQPEKAIRILETGLDYIIDDKKMEGDFYKQISISYIQLNNTVKAKSFSDKAKQLESTN
ncbi:tetratricopeptide repeat protein [Lacinutrix sp. C3R15]|uniref:tetratricopeptide repeat protein n=1 Tax=Flavobacteriaceae TaxID=49546 RepID=UPI001C09993F|nr:MULTISPECIES: tetratricopeptide repeat protein [Flavobacteriaceae]MBU2938094.1 tetratricopeptide repeat protein [Lacinutrix sp. C3R15]MDO6621408.1 tetratricopeptide repeat protein [Oceanihabitans sp. 1_MG-2023]